MEEIYEISGMRRIFTLSLFKNYVLIDDVKKFKNLGGYIKVKKMLVLACYP